MLACNQSKTLVLWQFFSDFHSLLFLGLSFYYRQRKWSIQHVSPSSLGKKVSFHGNFSYIALGTFFIISYILKRTFTTLIHQIIFCVFLSKSSSFHFGDKGRMSILSHHTNFLYSIFNVVLVFVHPPFIQKDVNSLHNLIVF